MKVRSTRIGLLAVVALAVLSVLAPPSPAGATPTPSFSDVSAGHAFFTEIEWMADTGISTGYPDGTYKPTTNVTRQSMSAFLYRTADLLGHPSVPFTPPATPTFSDVPTSHAFYTEIEWMADTGISTGYPDGTYKPTTNVTRQSMSAFLYRTADLLGHPSVPFTPPATPTFSDVPTSHAFYTEIEWMADTGISTGYPDGTYKPTTNVTRQSMSAFLYRTAWLVDADAHADWLCTTQDDVPDDDCYALVALYDSTTGPHWTNQTGFGHSFFVCSWYGVTCANGAVEQLSLSVNNLQGPIPTEIGLFTAIEILSIGFDYGITGSIPSSIGDLASLESLSLYRTAMTGSIPASLGQLDNLSSLLLYQNALTGSIPSALGNMDSIGSIALFGNQLTGSIPGSLGTPPYLTGLHLQWNSLSGTIPSQLGNLPVLAWLDLSGNNLTGSVPSTFSGLDELAMLDVSGNQLSGAFPSSITSMTALWKLNLSHNSFTGAIPTGIGNLTDLEILALADNQFSGTVPASITNLTALDILQLMGNGCLTSPNATVTAFLVSYDANWNDGC